MRIAMIGSRGVGSGYGGIERMLDELCPRLCDLGHKIDVFSRQNVAADFYPGLHAIRTPALAGKYLENISRSLRATVSAAGQYDVIHFHAIGPGILSGLTRLLQQPSVVTIHGRDGKRKKWGPIARGCLDLAEQVLVGNATRITVVSEALHGYFLDRYALRTDYIPNGLPRKKRRASGAFLRGWGVVPGKYVLFASRLVPEKGAQDLIAAFNRIDNGQKLVIAGGSGDPAYIDRLKAAADPARVVFVGHRSGDELAELFSNASLFVLPSYMEGMSMALLEAVEYGLPLLVSDIPENRAVLGLGGAWFVAGDITGLTNALSQITSGPRALSSAVPSTPLFDLSQWEKIAERYDRAYHAVQPPVRAPKSAPESAPESAASLNVPAKVA